MSRVTLNFSTRAPWKSKENLAAVSLGGYEVVWGDSDGPIPGVEEPLLIGVGTRKLKSES